MLYCKNVIITVGLVLVLILSATSLTSCQKTPGTGQQSAMPNPVDIVGPHKARPNMQIPPGSPGWPQQPYVNSVQLEVSNQDKIYFDLFTSGDNKRDVSFSKYTFYNRRTGEEIEIALDTPEDLGPFRPGQQNMVAFRHPVAVPEQPDIYELRVYLGDKMVASGLIEVKKFSPVSYIGISKATPGVVPDFGAGEQKNPHPDSVQLVLSPRDRIYLGLEMNKESKEAVTFSKYTFYDRSSNQETALETLNDLGPFQPGQLTLVAFDHPWVVPDQPGIYEVRIYVGSDIVASALFEVK